MNPWFSLSSSAKCEPNSELPTNADLVRFFDSLHKKVWRFRRRCYQKGWLIYLSCRFFRITNLKYWGRSEIIISKTLQLLSDLSVGYGTVRKMVKLEEVSFLLSHHTAEHYPFLGVGVAVSEMRCRTMFYISLGRLLIVELGEDEEKFEAFMMPLTQSFESLGRILLNQSAGYNSEEVGMITLDR